VVSTQPYPGTTDVGATLPLSSIARQRFRPQRAGGHTASSTQPKAAVGLVPSIPGPRTGFAATDAPTLPLKAVPWGAPQLLTQPEPGRIPGRPQENAARPQYPPRQPILVALLPAHNEEASLPLAIACLRTQTQPPDHIVVVSDNSVDGTTAAGRQMGADVVETRGNTAKKAGALNQALASMLPTLRDDDLILVQDADSRLDEHFLEAATYYLRRGFGGVGGVFRGAEGGGFVGHLQRNEYGRYARDVDRLNGKCLVITGTAALFRAGVLRQISMARISGKLPAGDGRGGVYDTTVLTEDNELTFALLHLGHRVISPIQCTLVTEVMETWGDLWRQRLRWKRGAVENCIQYGLTPITWRYWGRQVVTLLGCLVSVVYIASIAWALVTDSLNLHPFWLAVSLVFVVERSVTVRYRGWQQVLLAATMYELVLDYFLQACHIKAYFDAAFKRARNWN
jgi:poly-beta-1,6-N-acetyl-D-glucosamine synthase